MKKTCFNCKNFVDTLCDPHTTYHVHYWCRQWNVTLATPCGLADRYEYKGGVYYDDLETGDACCYMFEEKDAPMYEDTWFQKNKQTNLENRIEESE